MKDYFKEQLVKKQYTKEDKKKRIIILIITAAAILFLWNLIDSVATLNPEYYYSFMVLLAVVIIIAIAIALKLTSNLNCEFEYAYTSGYLDIDKIINQKKRKRVFSGCVEEFELMTCYGDTQHLAMYDSLKTKDFTSGEIKDNTYVFVTIYKGKKYKFMFEPCAEIINAARTDLSPRRLFIKK